MALSLKTFIYESDDVATHDLTPIVICPGRFNPPHAGHKFIFEQLKKLSTELSAEPVIIVVDSGKYSEQNPLTGEVRKQYIEYLEPGIKTIVAKNPYDAVFNLKEDGFLPVGGVVGKDRADSYKQMIGRLLGPAVMNQYTEVVIDRDPDIEGIAGVSGTAIRAAVKDDNFQLFNVMVNYTPEQTQQLFILLKQGLGR